MTDYECERLSTSSEKGCRLNGGWLFIYLHKCGDGECDEAECHDEDEEVLVADVLGYETGDYAGEHYSSEILSGGADGEYGCGAFAAREGDEEEGVGGIAQSVAYLLNAHTGGCEPEAAGGEEAEIDIYHVGEGDAQD